MKFSILVYKIGNSLNIGIKGRKKKKIRINNKDYMLIFNKRHKFLLDLTLYEKLLR